MFGNNFSTILFIVKKIRHPSSIFLSISIFFFPTIYERYSISTHTENKSYPYAYSTDEGTLYIIYKYTQISVYFIKYITLQRFLAKFRVFSPDNFPMVITPISIYFPDILIFIKEPAISQKCPSLKNNHGHIIYTRSESMQYACWTYGRGIPHGYTYTCTLLSDYQCIALKKGQHPLQ